MTPPHTHIVILGEDVNMNPTSDKKISGDNFWITALYALIHMQHLPQEYSEKFQSIFTLKQIFDELPSLSSFDIFITLLIKKDVSDGKKKDTPCFFVIYQ